MVTATVNPGLRLGQSVADAVEAGGSGGDEGDVQREVGVRACLSVVPADPAVTQATCVNGVVTVPTVTPRGRCRAGCTYTVVPAGCRSQARRNLSVTVTATLAAGCEVGGAVADGVEAGVPAATTAVFTVSLVGGGRVSRRRR